MRRRNPAAAVTVLVGRVLHEGRVADGWLRIEAGLVVELGWGEPPEPRAARYISGTISRGLVDLQVNGAGGESVTDGVDALVRIGERLLARGVTSFLPTVITTNLRLDEIDPRLSSRMADQRLSIVFALQVPPYRLGGDAPDPRGRPPRPLPPRLRPGAPRRA